MPAVRSPAGGGGVPALLSPAPVRRVCQADGHLPFVWHRRQRDAEAHHRLVTQPWHRQQGRVVGVRFALEAWVPRSQRRGATVGQQHKGNLLCLLRPQSLWDAEDPRNALVGEWHSLSGVFCCGALWTGLEIRSLWLRPYHRGFPYNADILRRDLNASDPKFIEFSFTVLHRRGKNPLFNRLSIYINRLTETTHFTQTQNKSTVQSHCRKSHDLLSSACFSVFSLFPVSICKCILRYSMMKKYFYVHIINHKKRWKNVFWLLLFMNHLRGLVIIKIMSLF